MTRTTPLQALSLCLLLTGLSFAAQNRWELLGRQQVDFRRDHDRINLGRHEGKVRQLRIRVQGGAIEMDKMTVTFANDQTFSPQLRRRFDEGSDSHVIDLPGDRRTIKTIEFWYRSINRRGGKATVEVYGR